MRSKTWVKDRGFNFSVGDMVKLVRKKPSGHPRSLELGCSYVVRKVENDDLFVQDKYTNSDLTKVNKNYFVPIMLMRNELINDILSDD